MKHKYYRTIILLSLTGLIAGSLFANIYCSDNVGEWGVFNYAFLEKMKNININGKMLFQYVLWERIKIWLILFLLSFTSIGKVIRGGYIFLFGFVAGTICSTTVMEYGLKGTMYFLVLSLAAQLIFLVSVLRAMTIGQYIYKKNRYGEDYIMEKNHMKSVVNTAFITILLLIISVLVETMFNINFVKIFY